MLEDQPRDQRNRDAQNLERDAAQIDDGNVVLLARAVAENGSERLLERDRLGFLAKEEVEAPVANLGLETIHQVVQPPIEAALREPRLPGLLLVARSIPLAADDHPGVAKVSEIGRAAGRERVCRYG